MSITRTNIETVGAWTLQRREYSSGSYDYIISSDSKTAVNLYVNDRPDFKAQRTVYTVEYSPYSRIMDLEEAAEFVAHTQQALIAAISFQQAIDAAEGK